jgi:glycosyltransferase involved in cell wall biosynthesis
LREYLGRAGLLDQTKILPRLSDPFEWYGIADLYVSASDFEGGPIAVRDAMAFGLPIVAIQAGDVDEIILEGVTGYLCEPRSLAPPAS